MVGELEAIVLATGQHDDAAQRRRQKRQTLKGIVQNECVRLDSPSIVGLVDVCGEEDVRDRLELWYLLLRLG